MLSCPLLHRVDPKALLTCCLRPYLWGKSHRLLIREAANASNAAIAKKNQAENPESR
jgi:hypothetical protein